jgi:hypothetical protein
MTFLVADAALYGCAGVEHVTYRLAEGLGTVEHAAHALTDIQAAIDEIGQQRGRDRRVLRRALPQPERDLHALRRDPKATTLQRPFRSTPSSISTARRMSSSVLIG